MTTLVRPDPNDGGLQGLRARLAQLESLLDQRATEVDAVAADLEAFRITYRQQVGLLHEQLDELELAIAEAELGELSRRLAGEPAREKAAAGRAGQSGPTVPPVRPARFTSDAARQLFREVAKVIHPDLARDDLTRDRRHALMVAANRAYALGDEEQLRWILEAWERSPEAVRGSDPDATRQRLVRRVAQVEEELERLASELLALKESSLWKLKAMVDDAAARGKDLVAQMVKQLKRDIMAATNRLDAMRHGGEAGRKGEGKGEEGKGNQK